MIPGSIFLLLLFSFSVQAFDLAPCTGESADVCGFLPSTYSALSLGGVPAGCNAACPSTFKATPAAKGGWDRCGVCGGLATYSQVLLEPIDPPGDTYIGGSVASWNGTVAASQHIGQYAIDTQYTATTPAPITTWNRDPVTGLYTLYQLPWQIGDAVGEETYVPVGRGYALIMGANHLVIGSHDTQPREVQVWTRTPNSATPWQFAWRSPEFCPGAHFGYDVAIDENPPRNPDQAPLGTVIVGDPSAHTAGAVSVHFTNDNDIVQILYHGGTLNATDEMACFGQSVSADGGYLAVGAPAFRYGGTVNAGQVYIYQWNPSAGVDGEYEYRTYIPPPTPVVNGGFGETVSVWNDELIIGDNQRTLYKYKLLGAVAVSIGINNPTGLPAISRLGYSASIWQDYVAAGDNTYVISATQQGATFVWDRNPLLPNEHRGPRYTLHDEGIGNFNTHYGTDVDLRGGNGCFVASGTIAEDTAGGVWVVDLCRDDCYGCDAVLNSCTVLDECDVCAGDNSTCTDCNGIINGPSMPDACGVCDGTNSTCVNPTASPVSILTSCETPFNVTLTYPFGNQHGPATWSLEAPLPTTGSVVFTYVSATQTILTYSPYPYTTGSDTINLVATVPTLGINDTLSIPVTLGSCVDCYGVVNGPARPDLCGVCEGDNSTCAGCDGVPNSGLVLDYCGVCGGSNSTCVDILLEPFYEVPCYSQIVFQLLHEPAATPVNWTIVQQPTQGSLGINHQSGYVVYMNPVIMGDDSFKVMITSLLNSSVTDMQNVSLHIMDCMDCDNSTLGIQILDACGECDGDGSTCAGCDGIPNSGTVPDLCGVCGGNNACLDCFGLPNGNATYALDAPDGVLVCCSLPIDLCNVCGGTNECVEAKGVVVSVFFWGLPIFLIIGLFLYNFHDVEHYAHWRWYQRFVKGRSARDVNNEVNDLFVANATPDPTTPDKSAENWESAKAAFRRNNNRDAGFGTKDTISQAETSAANSARFRSTFFNNDNLSLYTVDT